MDTTLRMQAAQPEELPRICDWYWRLADQMHKGEPGPAWTRGVYPSEDDLRKLVHAGELYVAEDGTDYVAGVAITHDANEGYDNVEWPSGLPQEDTVVVHLLALAPELRGQGYGSELVTFCVERAQEMDAQAVRLDVLAGNTPAERLYESYGFEYAGEATVFYEDTGWADFKLYELEL